MSQRKQLLQRVLCAGENEMKLALYVNVVGSGGGRDTATVLRLGGDV